MAHTEIATLRANPLGTMLALAISALGLIVTPFPMVEVRQISSVASQATQASRSVVFPTTLVADLLDDFGEQEKAKDAAIEARVRRAHHARDTLAIPADPLGRRLPGRKQP